MSPGLFLAYQILPSTVAWLCTTYWIKYCWVSQKSSLKAKESSAPSGDSSLPAPAMAIEEGHPLPENISEECKDSDIERHSTNRPSRAALALTPRELRLRNNLLSKVSYVVSSPIPYLGTAVIAFMIVLIFLNVMPIAATVSITAVLLVSVLVLGGYWMKHPIWVREDGQDFPSSHRERAESLADFFEELFGSIGTKLHRKWVKSLVICLP